MKYNKVIIIFLLSFCLYAILAIAQVTLGVGIEPLKGALLELENFPLDTKPATGEKSFVLPQVCISSLNVSQTDIDDKSKLYNGVQVFSTNNNAGLGLLTQYNNQSNKATTKESSAKENHVLFFKQTGDKETYRVAHNGETEIVSLGTEFVAAEDGNIYLSAILYAKMQMLTITQLRQAEVGNTFFKIQVYEEEQATPIKTFLAASSPISIYRDSPNSQGNNNPVLTSVTSIFRVKKGVKYTIRVLATEAWISAADATATDGRYVWRGFYAYSTLKLDFIADPY